MVVGAVDVVFPPIEDDVSTALSPDLNHATAILEPTVGEMDTAFPAPEAEDDVEGAPPPPYHTASPTAA
ncbi:MAG: hypothetical protein GXP38_12500, partial [Chloroflexi bacterium]|nr:hypothetical protein [Chloroflexota bacterium]